MNRRSHGFTLMELVIVIFVIGILAAIIMVSWSGLAAGSRDSARQQDIQQWASTFDLYKSRYSVWPALPTGDGSSGTVNLCLGSFSSAPPSGKCGQYTSGNSLLGSDSALLTANIAKMGSNLTNNGPAISSGANGLIGPYVRLSQTTAAGNVTVTGLFIGFFENGCPTDAGWSNDSLNSPSSTMLTGMTGVAKACALTKTFIYAPS